MAAEVKWRTNRPVASGHPSSGGKPPVAVGAVKARLAALHPEDKAVGYAVGQIRGAMTIRKPLRILAKVCAVGGSE
jgi:hypothetical protein